MKESSQVWRSHLALIHISLDWLKINISSLIVWLFMRKRYDPLRYSCQKVRVRAFTANG